MTSCELGGPLPSCESEDEDCFQGSNNILTDTNMCFIIGQLLSAGVLKGLATMTSEWGYRIPFAIQWLWPCFLIPTICFAPESPWYLVRQNRLEAAEVSIRRLQSAPESTVDPKKTLATIVYTK